MQKKNIVWTAEEWRAFAQALMAVSAEYATSLPAIIRTHDMQIAIKRCDIPEERRRPVHSSSGTTWRAGLEKAYREILETTPAQPEPVECETRKRIFWRDDEYLALARELHKMEPTSYLNSTTLAGLSPSAMREAERRALPAERHRHLTTVTGVRAPLLTAFQQLKTILAQEAEEQAVQAQATPQPVPAPEPVAQVNPYEAAFRPFLDLLAEAVIQRIAATYPPHPAAQQPVQPSQQANAPRLQDPTPAPFRAPPKPKIGVVGTLAQQAQEIAKEFPQFDFVFEKTKIGKALVEAMHSTVKIIGMTDFISHPHQYGLKNAYGDRYAPVHGGVSAIKRQIRLWMNSGALPA